MKIDLFATTRFDCVTESFGIYDDSGLPEEPSKIVPFEDKIAIAKIENNNNWNIYFVPIDKNIICYKPNSKDKESQCDALLICVREQKMYDFYFVELKEKEKSRNKEGVEQLKITILNFRNSYSISCISKKRAFLANKKHPYFNSGFNEEKEKFRNETGFMLIICADIPIK
jgi:hypothetical protein